MEGSMKNHRIIVVLLGFMSLVLMSCASAKFSYELPPAPSMQEGEKVIATRNVQDERADKSIDAIYERNPFEDINSIVKEEVMSTGLFKDILIVPDERWSDHDYLRQNNVDLVLDMSVKKLMWEVPNYDQIITTAFVTSLFTLGIGGLIYGSTSTDVYGHVLINAKLIDPETGKTLIDKDYIGTYKDTMAKLSCDTPGTKSKVIGSSFKNCMNKFKADLESAVASLDSKDRHIAIKGSVH